MRAVLVNVSEAFVASRRLLGTESLDERWAGEWHFVDPPHSWSSFLSGDLLRALSPLARRAGLQPYGRAAIVVDPETDWRIPDQVYARPEHEGEWLTGAELVVEVRSPDDESYLKLPFYAGRDDGPP
jgi:Uma2 family endonuclease